MNLFPHTVASSSAHSDWLKGRQNAKACRMSWKTPVSCSGSAEWRWNLAVWACLCVCERVRGLGNRFSSRRQYVWSLWHHGLIRKSWDTGPDRQTGVLPSTIDTCLPDFFKSGHAAHSLKCHIVLLQPQDYKYSGKNHSLQFKCNYVYVALILLSGRSAINNTVMFPCCIIFFVIFLFYILHKYLRPLV